MLKIVSQPRFTHDVDVEVPVDGGFKTNTFKATFNVVPTDEVVAMSLGLGDDSKFLERALHSASNIVDDEDKPISFSADIKKILLTTPYISNALIRAYGKGVAGAKSGN